MIVQLLTEHHLEFLSLKGGYKGTSESTLVKVSNCWKSHATAHLLNSLRKRDKMLGKPRILSLFPNSFNKFNKT